MAAAIVTKYHGPTNTQGSRISATANGHRIYLSYPHELNDREAHILAACNLIAKLNWFGELVTGCIEGGHYVHCFTKNYHYNPKENNGPEAHGTNSETIWSVKRDENGKAILPWLVK